VAVGILVGAGFGIYMTFARFRPDQQVPSEQPKSSE
jgi:hypothetical protein